MLNACPMVHSLGDPGMSGSGSGPGQFYLVLVLCTHAYVCGFA